MDWRKVSKTYVHLKEANIPEAHDSDRVHVLLGTDHAHLNASSRSIRGGDLEPVAREKTNKKMHPGGLTTSPSDDYLNGRNIPKLK